jgi:predicted RNA polymerase sigma factor
LVTEGFSGVCRYVPVQTEDFAEFYEASYRRVVALVAAIVGDRHQAEDIAQEAFSRALTRWQRVARYDLPEAWVRRVAPARRPLSIKPIDKVGNWPKVVAWVTVSRS